MSRRCVVAATLSDALETARALGVTVVRSHSVGYSTGGRYAFEPKLGVFNHSALDSADWAIAEAERLGMRLVLPLTTSPPRDLKQPCHYLGCMKDFTKWVGTEPYNFYNNSDVVKAFHQFVEARLEHVNAYTGRRAGDEPSIMVWESGNELRGPPASWTAELGRLIKRLAPRALFMDGNYGVEDASLAVAEVDLVSNHFYPPNALGMRKDAARAVAAGKVYVAGEYGWDPRPGCTRQLLFEVERNGDIAGSLFWSLFPHADDHGFVQHGDNFTYHYPGDDAAMRLFGYEAEAHNRRLSGVPAGPAKPPPLAPEVTLANVTHVAWRGAAAAETYALEASSSERGPWTALLENLSDNDAPVALPATALGGDASFVRVTAYGRGDVVGASSGAVPTRAAVTRTAPRRIGM